MLLYKVLLIVSHPILLLCIVLFCTVLYCIALPVSFGEHVVDNSQELHNPLIQVQIFNTFKQVGVSANAKYDTFSNSEPFIIIA